MCLGMPNLLADLHMAVRTLRRSPGFTLVAVATLALCVGANSAVFTLVNAALLRPLSYENPDKLVLVWESAPFFGLQDSPVAPANYFDWAKRSRSFEAMGALEGQAFRFTGEGEPEVAPGSVVTASLWRVLMTKPRLGRVFAESDDRVGAPKVAVISEGFWRRRFAGDESVVGRTIRLNDEPHTIVGVLARGSEPPATYRGRLGEVWTPLSSAYTAERLAERGRHNWMVMARLRQDVPLTKADAEMRAVGASLAREYPDTNREVGAFVAPLREHFVREHRQVLLLVLGTVFLLLLIGCLNLANLLVSRAAERAKEVALRTALGAGFWQLLRRFLWESLIICAIGSLLGIILATFSFEFLVRLAPSDLTGLNSLDIDWRVAAFTFAIAAGTTILFSILPVLLLRRLDIGNSLKQSSRTVASAAGSRRLRSALVCSEVALAFVMLIGAGLLIRALGEARSVHPGFRTRNVLLLNMPMSRKIQDFGQIVARQNELLRRVKEVPGVVEAGFTNNLPLLQKGNVSGIGAEGMEPGKRLQCQARVAGPGYFAAMGIPIVAGRALDARDAQGAPLTAMVNETVARRLWPGQSALGSMLYLGKEKVPIVGVAADIHQSGLETAPKPEFYVSSLQAGFPVGSMAIQTKADPEDLTAEVRKAVWSVDPDQPITTLTSMEQVIDDEFMHRNTHTTLLGAFAGLALLLASIGLYGVLSYVVGRQKQEIGLRMALGASPADMLRRVVGNSVRLVLAGVAMGVAGSLAAVQVLASLLFGVKPSDPTTYAIVAAILLATSAVASYLPARRAMRVEPMDALREE